MILWLIAAIGPGIVGFLVGWVIWKLVYIRYYSRGVNIWGFIIGAAVILVLGSFLYTIPQRVYGPDLCGYSADYSPDSLDIITPATRFVTWSAAGAYLLISLYSLQKLSGDVLPKKQPNWKYELGTIAVVSLIVWGASTLRTQMTNRSLLNNIQAATPISDWNVAEIGRIRPRSYEWIQEIDLTSDGRYALLSCLGQVEILDMYTLQPLSSLTNGWQSAVLNPDNSHIIVTNSASEMILYDLSNQQELWKIRDPDAESPYFGFHPKPGFFMASGDEFLARRSGHFIRLSVADGRTLGQLDLDSSMHWESNPNGSYLVSEHDNVVAVYPYPETSPTAILTAGSAGLDQFGYTSVIFLSNEELLVRNTNSGIPVNYKSLIWNLQLGTQRRLDDMEVEGAVRETALNTYVALLEQGTDLHVWNITNHSLQVFSLLSSIRAISLSADQRILLIVTNDGYLHIWAQAS